MTKSMKMLAKRDGRLLLAFLLFVVFAGLMIVQAWILLLYFRSIVHQDWTYFLKVFPSSALPPLDIGAACFDDCFPDLPFVPGWIGIVSFLLGLLVLIYIWWIPKSRGAL
jgi:hypothetical protein